MNGYVLQHIFVPLLHKPRLPLRYVSAWRLPLRSSVRPDDDQWQGPGRPGARICNI